MKKLLILSVVLLFLAVTSNAQTNQDSIKKEIKVLKKEESSVRKTKRKEREKLRKLEGAEVSYQAKQSFFKDFGDIPEAKWEREVNYDKVTFTKDGQVMSAFYDYDAKLVGTISQKTFTDLPPDAQKYINKKYAAYTKENVLFYDDNEFNETDMMLYDLQFDDADNYFVELKKDNKKIVLVVDPGGNVSFFKEL